MQAPPDVELPNVPMELFISALAERRLRFFNSPALIQNEEEKRYQNPRVEKCLNISVNIKSLAVYVCRDQLCFGMSYSRTPSWTSLPGAIKQVNLCKGMQEFI